MFLKRYAGFLINIQETTGEFSVSLNSKVLYRADTLKDVESAIDCYINLPISKEDEFVFFVTDPATNEPFVQISRIISQKENIVLLDNNRTFDLQVRSKCDYICGADVRHLEEFREIAKIYGDIRQIQREILDLQLTIRNLFSTTWKIIEKFPKRNLWDQKTSLIQ